MGKSSLRHSAPLKESWMNRSAHPIWRGVGFALMVLAPIMAYVSAELLLEENAKLGWAKIPLDLIVKWQDPMILVKVILTAVITFVFFMVLTLIYFLISGLFGPSRYGPTDIPPVAYKGKNYKR